MSMPCSSITLSRSSDTTSDCIGTFSPISAIASGTSQWACTSMVLTRLPLTTTSRRRDAGAWATAPPVVAQPTKARPAIAPAVRPSNSRRLVFIFLLPVPAGLSGENIPARLTGLGLAPNNVQSSCADLFRVSTSLFQPPQGVDGRHKAGQDEIGGAMFLPSSLRDFPRTALRYPGRRGCSIRLHPLSTAPGCGCPTGDRTSRRAADRSRKGLRPEGRRRRISRACRTS